MGFLISVWVCGLVVFLCGLVWVYVVVCYGFLCDVNLLGLGLIMVHGCIAVGLDLLGLMGLVWCLMICVSWIWFWCVSCYSFGCGWLLDGAVLMCRFVFVSCVVCALSFVDLPRVVW